MADGQDTGSSSFGGEKAGFWEEFESLQQQVGDTSSTTGFPRSLVHFSYNPRFIKSGQSVLDIEDQGAGTGRFID